MLPMILALAADPDQRIRLAAIDAICWFTSLRDESALPVLRRRLDDDNHLCRLRAASALWYVTFNKEVFPLFLRELENPSEEVRAAAIDALSYHCALEPEVYPHVIAASRDRGEQVFRDVTKAMSRFRLRGMRSVTYDLDDPDTHIRKDAVILLGRMGPAAKVAIPTLEQRLHDPDREIQTAAMEALLAIDPDRFQHLKARRKTD
jgi:HEAT repeat protein